MQIGEYLRLVTEADGTKAIYCRCNQRISRADENYKLFLVRRDLPIRAANLYADPHGLSGDRFQYRQFLCGACGLLLESEIALAEDPVLWDVEILGPPPGGAP